MQIWSVPKACEREEPYAGHLLAGRLRITHVACMEFPPGQRMPDTVVVSNRLIFVLSGRLCYCMEQNKKWLEAGDQLFVPAWSRRSWTSPAASGKRAKQDAGCTLLWCEFWSEASPLPPALYWRKPASDQLAREDEAALRQVLADWTALLGEKVDTRRFRMQLRMEGFLKRCLGCFWADVSMPDMPSTSGSNVASMAPLHPAVAEAVAWLESHFSEPVALDDFYARGLMLSPNHFRRLFRQQTGETVQQMLARLRLRHARYLVHQSALPLKVVALESGFNDPLYFSQCYHRFWEISPSADRHTSTLA